MFLKDIENKDNTSIKSPTSEIQNGKLSQKNKTIPQTISSSV